MKMMLFLKIIIRANSEQVLGLFVVKMPLYIFSMKNTRLDIYIFDKHSMGKYHARKLRLILKI